MRKKRATRQRGAVLVEALILISTLVTCFLGLIYFRDLYLDQLRVLRLARAAAIAHSLAACSANSPELWLDLDLGGYRSNTPLQDQLPAAGSARTRARPLNTAEAQRARRFIQSSSTGSSDGEGLLNPVTTTDLSGNASVGAGNTQFQGESRALSHVSCSDGVKQRRYADLVSKLSEEFTSLFGSAFGP
jgi:Tfp pilus assembly protein PilX